MHGTGLTKVGILQMLSQAIIVALIRCILVAMKNHAVSDKIIAMILAEGRSVEEAMGQTHANPTEDFSTLLHTVQKNGGDLKAMAESYLLDNSRLFVEKTQNKLAWQFFYPIGVLCIFYLLGLFLIMALFPTITDTTSAYQSSLPLFSQFIVNLNALTFTIVIGLIFFPLLSYVLMLTRMLGSNDIKRQAVLGRHLLRFPVLGRVASWLVSYRVFVLAQHYAKGNVSLAHAMPAMFGLSSAVEVIDNLADSRLLPKPETLLIRACLNTNKSEIFSKTMCEQKLVDGENLVLRFRFLEIGIVVFIGIFIGLFVVGTYLALIGLMDGIA